MASTDAVEKPPSPLAEGVVIPPVNNFITHIIDEDIREGRCKLVTTRFPPEPNGWLHLGHAKSICLNFGLAAQYGGKCHLRFDDTNPSAEEEEYIEGIMKDVEWLGFRWHKNLFFASDYFEQLYQFAIKLIKAGLAYVDHQNEEEVRNNRGTLTTPGVNSPFRDRTIEENLDLFARMRAGEFPDGHCVLRAKIDMSHGNMNMRDPPMYRIKHCDHPRTGGQWCIYPIYDYAHGQSDSIEKISHSICTLEFYDHRMLYDWFIEKLEIHPSHQYEFARCNISHTVMSKRRLLKLVKENMVRGWDDPRMPTIAGSRRRGYPPSAIREFAVEIGVAKRDNVIPIIKLEGCVRNALSSVPRKLAVLDPIRVVITSWPNEDHVELVTLKNHPELDLGTRQVKMGKTIYIDRTDFMEEPNATFHRLAPGKEVRLRGACWIRCEEVTKDAEGHVIELKCTHDPSTMGGNPPTEKRTVKGVIHWVSDIDSIGAEIRMYETLFSTPDPDEGGDWVKNLNPRSLVIMDKARVERSLTDSKIGDRFQFERLGFFNVDEDSKSEEDSYVFNLTVSLLSAYAEGDTDAELRAAKAREEAKVARARAAEERRLKKLAKEQRAQAKAAAVTPADETH